MQGQERVHGGEPGGIQAACRRGTRVLMAVIH
jgi:hypothetical protein